MAANFRPSGQTPPRVSPNRPTPAPAAPSTPSRSRFAKAQESAKDSLTGAFYSAEAKAALFDNLTPIWLHGAKVVNSQFGEQWYLDITDSAPDNNHGTLALSRNNYRDTLFGDLAKDLEFDPTPIGPLMLTKMMTKAGQESWDIIEWNQEGRPPF